MTVHPLQFIDSVLNRITMYRLVVYILSIYVGLSLLFALPGHLPLSPTALIVSLFLMIGSTYASNKLCSHLFKVPVNVESWLITALILFLVVRPADTLQSAAALCIAGSAACASKFLLAWRGKHIFNPAAFGAALVCLSGLQASAWWVGSMPYLPFTLLLGLAVVRKVRRVSLFVSFVVVAIALQACLLWLKHQTLLLGLEHAVTSSPMIFLATIMLTEPATMPPRRFEQIVFAEIVAVLYVVAWQFGQIIIFPEVALLIGNMYAFIVAPKYRLKLRLKEIQQFSDSVYNYVFEPNRPVNYRAGQYIELTLDNVPYDNRGNRRTFSIASSPTEDEIHIGLKHNNPSSTFKATMQQLQPGDTVYATQIAGNFTLPDDRGQKVALIAGGIGITPFRSMMKYIVDTDTSYNAVLLYAVGSTHDFAYIHQLRESLKAGLKILLVVTRPTQEKRGVIQSKVNADLISSTMPDYIERTFYVSGSDPMVRDVTRHLRSLGVKPKAIITDQFSGY